MEYANGSIDGDTEKDTTNSKIDHTCWLVLLVVDHDTNHKQDKRRCKEDQAQDLGSVSHGDHNIIWLDCIFNHTSQEFF